MTGLDVESEATVRQALDRLMAGKTCLMITHDLPSITDADLVLLLEEGRIIDRGTHSERSEEHTSELQSRLHLVCRLLLEKKKLQYKTCKFDYDNITQSHI